MTPPRDRHRAPTFAPRANPGARHERFAQDARKGRWGEWTAGVIAVGLLALFWCAREWDTVGPLIGADEPERVRIAPLGTWPSPIDPLSEGPAATRDGTRTRDPFAFRMTRRKFADAWKSGRPVDDVTAFVAAEHRDRLRAEFEQYVARRGKYGVPPLFPPGAVPDSIEGRVEDSFKTDDWVPATFSVVWTLGPPAEIVEWSLPAR